MLEEEFQYFIDNQEKLANLHPNKILVIKGREVIGTFASKGEAYRETAKHHQVGTFLIQETISDPSELTQLYISHVIV